MHRKLHSVIFGFIVAACMLPVQTLWAQDNTKDTSAYKKLAIKKTELDFVTSYYGQQGDHSAVTGGKGTEKLDFVGAHVDVNLLMQKGHLEHAAGISVGLDYYSSASSDNIDPFTISSASSADIRVNPTFSWTITNLKKNFSVGANLSASTEFDYKSIGFGISGSKTSKDQNRELSLKWQSYFDQWKLVRPVELRPPGNRFPDEQGYATSPRNSHSASLTFSQVLNKRMQVLLTGDFVYQEGQLSTPFHRVYVQGESLAHLENLPATRTKIPLGIRFNYFFVNGVILRSFYRYYSDDWGITAHTLYLELPVKINPFLSVYPFYRYHTQTATSYFKPYGEHLATEEFITSDYDLSAMNTQLAGAGVRWSPLRGIARMPKLKSQIKSLELRYGYYSRSNGLTGNTVSLHLSFSGF